MALAVTRRRGSTSGVRMPLQRRWRALYSYIRCVAGQCKRARRTAESVQFRPRLHSITALKNFPTNYKRLPQGRPFEVEKNFQLLRDSYQNFPGNPKMILYLHRKAPGVMTGPKMLKNY